MRSKKTRAKTAKPPVRGKRPVGLTSAIGPKATTAVVILVLAGGIWYGSRQHLAAKAKTAAIAADTAEMTSDPTIASTLGATQKKASTARVHDASASQPVLEASAQPKSARGPVTTIEGCLVQSGDAYRLKGTSGVDAPKARSWRSGFLKKGPAMVDVVDTSESLGLPNRVGTRVSVTGTLVDREMQARTVHRLSSSCN